MKRFLATILALVTALALLAAPAAASEENGELIVNWNENMGSVTPVDTLTVSLWDVIALTAEPYEGYIFTGWRNDSGSGTFENASAANTEFTVTGFDSSTGRLTLCCDFDYASPKDRTLTVNCPFTTVEKGQTFTITATLGYSDSETGYSDNLLIINSGWNGLTVASSSVKTGNTRVYQYNATVTADAGGECIIRFFAFCGTPRPSEQTISFTVVDTHSLSHEDRQEPTCMNPGHTAGYTCSRCGRHFSNEAGENEILENDWVLVDPDAHTWEAKKDADKHWQECACGAKQGEEAHTWSGWAQVENTDTHRRTCSCGAEETENCTGGAATCTDPAVCDKCGQPYGEVDKNAHPEDRIVTDPAEEPTCTKDGKTEGKHCSVCGEVLLAQETVPAGHTMVTDPAEEATCTKSGKTEGKHCSVCGEVLLAQETVPATGHTEVTDPAEEPTCTKSGKTEGKHCSVCGEVLLAQETVPAKGHTEVTDPAEEATCTKSGKTEGKHCSECGEVLSAQKEIPAPGHWFGPWQPDSSGSHIAECLRQCGYAETVPCAMITLPQEEGKEEISFCPVCGSCEGAENLTPSEDLALAGEGPRANLHVFTLENGEDRYLIVAFEKNGQLFQPEGEIAFAPMEALAETSFAQVNPDGTETALTPEMGENGVILTLDFTPEGKEPVPVMILKMN